MIVCGVLNPANWTFGNHPTLEVEIEKIFSIGLPRVMAFPLLAGRLEAEFLEEAVGALKPRIAPKLNAAGLVFSSVIDGPLHQHLANGSHATISGRHIETPKGEDAWSIGYRDSRMDARYDSIGLAGYHNGASLFGVGRWDL